MKMHQITLLLMMISFVCVFDVDAKPRRRRFHPHQVTRRRRSVEESLSLPCDFMLYDADSDGYIDTAEVKEIFSMFDPSLVSPDNVNLVIQKLDLNGDDLIEFEEFYMDPDFQKDCIIAKMFKATPKIKTDFETFV